jgi:hypothetical protein
MLNCSWDCSDVKEIYTGFYGDDNDHIQSFNNLVIIAAIPIVPVIIPITTSGNSGTTISEDIEICPQSRGDATLRYDADLKSDLVGIVRCASSSIECKIETIICSLTAEIFNGYFEFITNVVLCRLVGAFIP